MIQETLLLMTEDHHCVPRLQHNLTQTIIYKLRNYSFTQPRIRKSVQPEQIDHMQVHRRQEASKSRVKITFGKVCTIFDIPLTSHHPIIILFYQWIIVCRIGRFESKNLYHA